MGHRVSSPLRPAWTRANQAQTTGASVPGRYSRRAAKTFTPRDGLTAPTRSRAAQTATAVASVRRDRVPDSLRRGHRKPRSRATRRRARIGGRAQGVSWRDHVMF